MKSRASAAIPRIYRNKFHWDIYRDLSALQKGIDEENPEASTLDSFSLELFEDISHIMAKHADPVGVPDTADEWLDQFGTLLDMYSEMSIRRIFADFQCKVILMPFNE